MSTAEKRIRIAIDTTIMRDQGVRWPRQWKVTRGDLKQVLRERPRPNFVVMPFRRLPPEDAQIKQALCESLTKVIVFWSKWNRRASDKSKMRRWLTAFDFPERVIFTKDWDGVFLRVLEVTAKRALRSTKESQRAPRPSAIDEIKQVMEAGDDLRTPTGRLSAKPIAELFGISKSELARLLDRSPQALWKTPDAESLQNQLAYLERIGRLRLVLRDNENFRKWLRTANPRLANQCPFDLIRQKRWQVIADLADDMLVGSPG